VQMVAGRSTVRRTVQRFPLRRGCTVVDARERRVEGPRAKTNSALEIVASIYSCLMELTNVENRANVQRV
jgi:hypothetical protein